MTSKGTRTATLSSSLRAGGTDGAHTDGGNLLRRAKPQVQLDKMDKTRKGKI